MDQTPRTLVVSRMQNGDRVIVRLWTGRRAPGVVVGVSDKIVWVDVLKQPGAAIHGGPFAFYPEDVTCDA